MWSVFRRLFGRQEPVSAKLDPDPGHDARPRSRGKGERGDLLSQVESMLQGSDDVRVRRFEMGASGAKAARGRVRRGAVIFIKGLVDIERVEETVVRPLVTPDFGSLARDVADPKVYTDPTGFSALKGDADGALFLKTLHDHLLYTSEAEQLSDPEEAVQAILSGDVLLAFEGMQDALAISNPGGKARGVEDPILEVTLRGPRDGFTESLFVNTALIRRRVRDPKLRIEIKKVGVRSKTSIALVYVEDVTPASLVEEIKRRLDGIKIDAVLDSGYIEHMIEDEWWSPFPQHLKTERPDKAVAGLYEGRAVLITDTTPFTLIMPATLDSFFHSPEDSYDRWLPVSILRVIRFIAAGTSIITPSLYVALVAYHPGILPTEFLLRVKAAREGVAFPIVAEALLMMFFLELIKEAGFRLPSPIGQVFGIVGGLVLSDVGVRAGIVGEAMVIVIAITAISSFASIDREMGTVLRLGGLPVLISTSFLGLPGLMLALILIAAHLSALRSYGVPYYAPYPHYHWNDFKDTLIKAPIHTLRRRPGHLGARNKRRVRRAKSVADSKDEGGGSA